MAGGTEAQPSAVTNGAAPNGVNGAKASPSVLVPPQIGQRRMAAVQARSAARAATLELLESGADDGGTEIEAKPTTPTPVSKAPARAVEPPDETDDGPDDVDEPELEAKAPAAPKKDDPAAGGLAKVRDAEKRFRDQQAKEKAEMAKERAELERDRAEAKTLREKLAKYEELEKKAATDPVAAMKALNIDIEYGAKQAWSHHLATKDPANPQHREVAARMQKDREFGDELSMTKKELAEVKARMEQRETTEKTERETAQYFGGMAKAIEGSAETPLLKKAITKNPQGTWKKLAGITFELHQEHGELPDAADVIATYEKRRLEELDELDLAPPAVAAAAPTDSTTPKKNHPSADKKQPAKTLGNDLSTPRVVQPRSVKSEREHRAETLAMLESGKLE